MKKKNIYRIITAAMVLSLTALAPMASLTTHASWFNPDAGDDTEYPSRPADGGESGNAEPAPAPAEPAPAPAEPAPAPTESTGSNNSGSNSSSSEPAPAPAPAPTPAPAESTGSNNSGSNSSNSESAPAPAPAPAESVTEPTVEPAPASKAESAPAVKSTDAPAEKAKDSGTANKDGKLSYGKFSYIISRDGTVCKVYYDGKYTARFTVNDDEGNKVVIDSIAVKEDKNGYYTMDITVDKSTDAETVRVAVNKKGSYNLTKSIGVNIVTVNGEKVPLAVRKVPPTPIKENIR